MTTHNPITASQNDTSPRPVSEPNVLFVQHVHAAFAARTKAQPKPSDRLEGESELVCILLWAPLCSSHGVQEGLGL